MKLIEVQHCYETVRLTNVQVFNSKALFSKFLRYLTKVKIMKCTISLKCDDVDVEFVRSRTS